MQTLKPEFAVRAWQSKRGHPRLAQGVLNPCMQMLVQGLGALPVHFPLAVEVVGSHAPKKHPTMPSRKPIGIVKTAKENVPTVAASCRATQRLAPGVPHVHIHRAVEVVASPAHMKEDTTPSTSRFGSVKHAVYAMVTRRVQCAVCNARKKVVTMSKSCRTGPAKLAR